LENEDGILYDFLQMHYSQRREKKTEIIPMFFALEWRIYEMSLRYKQKVILVLQGLK
jgi:hypothetical protein